MRFIDRQAPATDQQGFSLLELMVVIFIVAIVSSGVGIAVGSVSSAQKQLDQAGRKLYAQMNFALDEALTKYQVLGLSIDKDFKDAEQKTRYQWIAYENDKPVVLQAPLTAVVLPEGMHLDIIVEDESFDLFLENALNVEGLDDEEADIVPAILFYPNGNMTEFELTISYAEEEDVKDFAIYLDERQQLTHSLQDTTSNKK